MTSANRAPCAARIYMIPIETIETNILVYSHRSHAPQHDRALDCLSRLIESGQSWTIPWPCIHEFISVVTKPVFDPPSSLQQAFDAVASWVETETMHTIGEGDDHLQRLQQIVYAR